MCLLFMYLNDDECGNGYRLIIANNRDEQWDKPTKPLSFWTDNEDCISGVYCVVIRYTYTFNVNMNN